MKMLVCALLVGVLVVVCPLRAARADFASEERAAAAVFRAMHDDLERCFEGTNANVYVRIEAELDRRGRVRRVEATGDRAATMGVRRCIERRVARARFPAPREGGTSRVRVSFVFAYA